MVVASAHRCPAANSTAQCKLRSLNGESSADASYGCGWWYHVMLQSMPVASSVLAMCTNHLPWQQGSDLSCLFHGPGQEVMNNVLQPIRTTVMLLFQRESGNGAILQCRVCPCPDLHCGHSPSEGGQKLLGLLNGLQLLSSSSSHARLPEQC